VPFLNDTFHPFGWDEISWFAHQPDEYRNWWLGYAANWLSTNDPKGHFEMPFLRGVCDPVTLPGLPKPVRTYDASSTAAAGGFGQEEAVKTLWDAQ